MKFFTMAAAALMLVNSAQAVRINHSLTKSEVESTTKDVKNVWKNVLGLTPN